MFGIGRQANNLANPAGATDTYWSSVVMLLPGDDSSYDPKIAGYRSISGSDVSSDATTKKFGSSLYFNNSDTPQNGTDSYVYASSSSDFAFGTGDWTAEGWVYAKRTTGLNVIFDGRTAGADISPNLFIYGGKWATYQNGWGFNSVGTVSVNTWYHFALVRSGSTSYLYADGTLVTSIADSRNYVQGGIRVGAGWNANDGLYGYLDDFRLTKGVARYSGNFTPPTTAYPTS